MGMMPTLMEIPRKRKRSQVMAMVTGMEIPRKRKKRVMTRKRKEDTAMENQTLRKKRVSTATVIKIYRTKRKKVGMGMATVMRKNM